MFTEEVSSVCLISIPQRQAYRCSQLGVRLITTEVSSLLIASKGSALYCRRYSLLTSAQGTPIIYVALNYRLGPLGFPVGAEAGQQNILNLGLQDQLAAIQWVNRNIGAFGGDKQKVSFPSPCSLRHDADLS